MFRYYTCALLLILLSCHVQADTGFRQLTLHSQSTRPLNVTIWYPSHSTGQLETAGENAAFYGESVRRDAVPQPEPHPLILLSHGYGGSWRNLNWLAVALVKQGYIVAAPDHPGTTTQNRDPSAAKQLWLRPQDINQLLDALLANAEWAGKVDSKRIAAIGHSLGGWTVMELVGARFSSSLFIDDCQHHPLFSDCKLIETLGINTTTHQALLDAPRINSRIKAAVSLDLGLARGFTPASLVNINVPVLVLSAEQDSIELPASLESGYLAQHIPTRWMQFTPIIGATHFSFMQRCKPAAAALIDKYSPGDGIICSDQGSRSREAIHQEIIARVTAFLAASLDWPAGEMRSASAH